MRYAQSFYRLCNRRGCFIALMLHLCRFHAPLVPPPCSTCVASMLHLCRLHAPLVSPPCSTCVTSMLHLCHLHAPLVSPPCSTCVASILHSCRLHAPLVSPPCSTEELRPGLDVTARNPAKRRGERRTALPEDMDWSVYLTEAQKCITTGNTETALKCAQKAVLYGGRDASTLTTRGRCLLLLGRLEEALRDAQEALQIDPSMVKAVLVQAEALYGMGEFERALVLYERGARARPDMVHFKRGSHQCREAILNVIGGRVFPEASGASAQQVADPQLNRGFSDTSARVRSSDPAGAEGGNRRGMTSQSRYSGSSRAFGSRSGKTPEKKSNKTKLLIPEIQTSKLASKAVCFTSLASKEGILLLTFSRHSCGNDELIYSQVDDFIIKEDSV
ncbi:Tetratricopeptide repeat 2 [Trinorchestia longiramus]|nr:Tetratricopeptide repeat 2 [Trinorchestia longiramus]